jgi:hypothetical protein
MGAEVVEVYSKNKKLLICARMRGSRKNKSTTPPSRFTSFIGLGTPPVQEGNFGYTFSHKSSPKWLIKQSFRRNAPIKPIKPNVPRGTPGC